MKLIDYVIQIPNTKLAKEYADDVAAKLRDAEQRAIDSGIRNSKDENPTVEDQSTEAVSEETADANEESNSEETTAEEVSGKEVSEEKPKRKPGPKAKAKAE